ncbi:beta family protein [Gluconobacter kondonii]|uniref:beta family protein n=1 Tax=Gluconobacter kondonii TaxID=941463 RepID=UPI001B8AB40F|nr:beta family protein [Gluconobacter kondonii]MBS1054344.1 beta family protein [Gluconobacter kondonii]
MPITNTDYVPILKWRQGEYQALFRLPDAVKDKTVPLIEITPPDFDFEAWTPSKSIDDHVAKFAVRFRAKWGRRLALLDCGLLDPAEVMLGGKHPMLYLCEEAFARGATIIPVIRLSSNAAYRAAVRAANALMHTGVILRCSLDEALDPDFDLNVDAALQQLGVTIADCDVVLDLEAPAWDPQDILINIVTAAIQASNAMATARSLILAGTSFPASMAEVTGPIQFWPRREWMFFRALLANLGGATRKLTFADYAIAANGYSQMDMRKVKPSATIRYACDDGWIIAKGTNVRDNGFGQYRGCSGTVTGSAHFLGSGFSPGSDYIEQCRDGIASTGSLSTWRWVGSNHHITKVVADLATMCAP